MPDILEFGLVAAAVDSHLRVGARRWQCESAVSALYDDLEGVRKLRAQHRNVFI